MLGLHRAITMKHERIRNSKIQQQQKNGKLKRTDEKKNRRSKWRTKRKYESPYIIGHLTNIFRLNNK